MTKYNPNDIELYEPELNEDLIKHQGVSEEKVSAIKEVHKHLYHVKVRPNSYEDPVDLIEAIEYTLQVLWGLEVNKDWHSHWNEIKGCTCPNDQPVGSGLRRVNRTCPWHWRKE